jgi:hypothetical protein
MLPAIRETFETVLGIGRYWSGDRVMEISDPEGRFLAKKADDPMWGRIILRSAEAQSGLEATTAKAAWLDEAGQPEFHVETWEAVLRRLSLAMGRALLTTTIYDLGWVKTVIYDAWVKGDPDIQVINFDSTENPAFPPEEALRAERSMPRWRYDMQYRGVFSRPAGMIYDCFDRACVIPRFYIPDNWKRYLGLDFGGVNTAGVYLAAEPGTRMLYAYRVYHAGQRTAVEHAREMLKTEPGVPTCVGGSPSEEQWRAEFRSGGVINGERVVGLPVRAPLVKEVQVGIDRVYACFKRNEIQIFDDLEPLISEIESYSYKVDSVGVPTGEIDNKAKYHRADALRYIVSWLRHPGRTPVDQLMPSEVMAKEVEKRTAAFEAQRRYLDPITGARHLWH